MQRHDGLERWVADMAALCAPDTVVRLDGSEEERARLEAEAVAAGELVALDPARHPGSFYHRIAPRDAARTEDLTFVCTADRADAGPTNNWMEPAEGYRRAADLVRGTMKGRTMYVVPFALGPAGSPSAKAGVQVTDSLAACLALREHVG